MTLRALRCLGRARSSASLGPAHPLACIYAFLDRNHVTLNVTFLRVHLRPANFRATISAVDYEVIGAVPTKSAWVWTTSATSPAGGALRPRSRCDEGRWPGEARRDLGDRLPGPVAPAENATAASNPVALLLSAVTEGAGAAAGSWAL